MNKICLGNNRYVDLNFPFYGVLGMSIEEIAHALSNINRFQGRLRRQVSVAEHSCVQACYVLSDPDIEEKEYRINTAFYCLMHDAAEVLTGDINGVIKPFIKCSVLDDIEDSFRQIYKPLMSEDYTEYAKSLDKVSAAVEAETFGLSDPYWKDVLRNSEHNIDFLTFRYLSNNYERPAKHLYWGVADGIDNALHSWYSLFLFLYDYLYNGVYNEHS